MMVNLNENTGVLSDEILYGPMSAGKHFDKSRMGLYVVVWPQGSRNWVQRITVHGKRQEIGLGGFPDTDTATARRIAAGNVEMVRRGGNPLLMKRQESE